MSKGLIFSFFRSRERKETATILPVVLVRIERSVIMKEMTELQLIVALAQGRLSIKKIKMDPVLVKTDRRFNVGESEVRIVSYIADADGYLGEDTLTANDICYIYKGRLHLLREYLRVDEDIEVAVMCDITNNFNGSFLHGWSAVAAG